MAIVTPGRNRMDNISIVDDLYNSCGFKPNKIQEQFQKDWKRSLKENISFDGSGKVILNNAPNRIGKTTTTLKWLDEKEAKVLYLADRHNHIEEVETFIGDDKFVHWYGLEQLCQIGTNPNTHFLLENGVPPRLICRNCSNKRSCPYWKQWKTKDNSIVGAPKELIPTKHVQKENWDVIVFDELVDKAKPIKAYVPELSEDLFKRFGIQDLYYTTYLSMKIIKENKDFSKDNITLLKDGVREIDCSLQKVVKQIKDTEELTKYKDVPKLIKWLSRYGETLDWAVHCSKFGYRTKYYRLYLYYVLDLVDSCGSDVVILNTSLQKRFYNFMVENYDKDLPELIEFKFTVQNKDSVLLHYNHFNRSFSKGALFKEDENGNMQLNNDRYGFKAYKMVKDIIGFCKSKSLKVGVITYKFAESFFVDIADSVGHFGGHQGSNQLDDVDVLLIYGTYTIHPGGLYQKRLMVKKEFLESNKIDWKVYKYINGCRVRFSNDESSNEIKLYKLNEEHGQAIFRSGAHVQENKIVIVFGFVPSGIENTLDYRTFNTARGAKISITKQLKKINNQK